jgi:hypothetical protein
LDKKEKTRKMKKLKGGDYHLFTYHHVAAIILQQPPSFVDLIKTQSHIILQQPPSFVDLIKTRSHL